MKYFDFAKHPVASLILFVLPLMSCGCNDLDLDLPGTETEDPPADPAQTATTPIQPPQPIPATPEQVIAEFRAKQPMNLTDGDLQKLAALESGLEAVEELDLKTANLSGAGLKALAAFPNLKKLDMQSVNVTDQAWEGLGELRSLEWLSLKKTILRDPGLVHIARLTNLKHLNVANTAVTEAGFLPLETLTALEELDVSGLQLIGDCLIPLGNKGAKAPLRVIRASGTKFGYSAFKYLREFPGLEELHVSSSSVSDGSIEGLRSVKTLKLLNLSNNVFTDKGASALSSLTTLENLNLNNNQGITDQGVARYIRLKALKELDIQGTSISAAGIQKIQKAVPDCEIRAQQQ